MESDKGLVVKNAAAHHAISAKFPKKIDNKGKTLVVQYEVKLQSEYTWRDRKLLQWLIVIQMVSNVAVPT